MNKWVVNKSIKSLGVSKAAQNQTRRCIWNPPVYWITPTPTYQQGSEVSCRVLRCLLCMLVLSCDRVRVPWSLRRIIACFLIWSSVVLCTSEAVPGGEGAGREWKMHSARKPLTKNNKNTLGFKERGRYQLQNVSQADRLPFGAGWQETCDTYWSPGGN